MSQVCASLESICGIDRARLWVWRVGEGYESNCSDWDTSRYALLPCDDVTLGICYFGFGGGINRGIHDLESNQD